jgi:hypothetical protein
LWEQPLQPTASRIGLSRHRGSLQVADRSVHPRGIVEEQPDPEVASSAQQAAHAAGHVVVIGVGRILVAADGAQAALAFEQLLALFDGDPEGAA